MFEVLQTGLDLLGAVLAIIASFAAALAMLSDPYRHRITSRFLGSGVVVLMFVIILHSFRRLTLNSFLLHNPKTHQTLDWVIAGFNGIAFCAILTGIFFYFIEHEGGSHIPKELAKAKLSRANKIGLVLAVATAIFGSLTYFSDLVNSHAPKEPLVLLSNPTLLKSGSMAVGVGNFSTKSIKGIQISFWAYSYTDIQVSDGRKCPIKSEYAPNLGTEHARRYTLLLGDLRAKECVVILTKSTSSFLASLKTPAPLERPFQEPVILEASHEDSFIPINEYYKISRNDLGVYLHEIPHN